jgi:hypothetical protein
MQAFIATLPTGDFQEGPVQPVKIGTLDGYGILIKVLNPGNQRQFDVRLAAVPDGRLILVVAEAQPDFWSQAQPVLGYMIDSIQVLPVPVSTFTPVVISTSAPTPSPTLALDGTP